MALMDAVRAAVGSQTDSVVSLLLFTLGDRRYAVRMGQVVRVAAIAAVAPLPGAPSVVAGVINVAGQFLPVLDVRARVGLPVRAPRLEDALVIVRTARRDVALWVDGIERIENRPATDLAPIGELVAADGYFDAVTALSDGPLFIHDVDRFLSMDEEHGLTAALARTVQP